MTREFELTGILDEGVLHLFTNQGGIHLADVELTDESSRWPLTIEELREQISAREAEIDNRLDEARIEEALMQERVRERVASLDD